ncbi:MAG: hypothetical protein HYS04_11425 [Acidobacteria bacterium]|nr:hypothetical protein [Acidobacteriota bacterium]
MFELLFKYPAAVFSKGDLVLLGSWPAWLLGALAAAAAAALAIPVWRSLHTRRTPLDRARAGVIWGLQTLFVALLLLVLWQPAVSVATLRPQQNVIAVLVDDSRSMAIRDQGSSRRDRAVEVLNGGLLDQLKKKFQVRLYRAGGELERIEKPDALNAGVPVTRLGEGLKRIASEATGLPIGAVVLLSDGGENAGGLDLPTINEIRRHRIPVHTVGFGREKPARDLEILDAQLPARSLADSRLSAQVSFRGYGYGGRKARLMLKEGEKTLASREVALKPDGAVQTESLLFNAGGAGAKAYHIALDPLDGEENVQNNALTRMVNIESNRLRILYIEGEPRWEYKFIRRAVEEDRNLRLISMLRTTQNKIYRQGIDDPKELEQGFPAKVEELFAYQGLIVGGVEAGYFTGAQLELIRQFADRRGGGVLFLGGRAGLAEGGYAQTPLAEMLPVVLPGRKNTFRRDPANVELTAAGRDSLLCRIEDDPERNLGRWKKLPYLMNYQDPGTPKPGAVVLADALPTSGGRLPLLITQNYGRGRTAVFATGGSWRWQMQQPLEDMSHEVFWQQLLRWLVSGTYGHVISSTPKSVLSDEITVQLRTEVRDRTYLPMADARVEARVLGPEGLAETVELRPDPVNEGVYLADWSALKAGSYVVEVAAKRGEEEMGRDLLSFRREDGVAEHFHTNQNRELLEKLSQQTGGRYYQPGQVSKLPEEISYSEGGISTRETRDLWNMPVLFLAALMIRSSEWLLRRRWGIV